MYILEEHCGFTKKYVFNFVRKEKPLTLPRLLTEMPGRAVRLWAYDELICKDVLTFLDLYDDYILCPYENIF